MKRAAMFKFFSSVILVCLLATTACSKDNVETASSSPQTSYSLNATSLSISLPTNNVTTATDQPTTSLQPSTDTSARTETSRAKETKRDRSETTVIQNQTALPKSTTKPDSSCLSAGSGGSATAAERQSFTSSSGTKSGYHVYPADNSEPPGLLIYLHGDGGYSYDSPRSMRSLQSLAQEQNLVMLVPKVPDGSNKSWWQEPERNGEWLRDLIETIGYGQYNIDQRRVILSGFSGGSDFSSLYFLPDHWDTFSCGGGAVLFGGGGKPWRSGDTQFSQSFKTSFAMHYYTGLADNGTTTSNCSSTYDALETSRAGAKYYKGQGFSTTSEHPQGIDHCNVDEAAVLSRLLSNGFL